MDDNELSIEQVLAFGAALYFQSDGQGFAVLRTADNGWIAAVQVGNFDPFDERDDCDN